MATATKQPTKRKTHRRAPAKEHWHGTYNGYSNHGCRCEECKAALKQYMADYRTRRFKGSVCSVKRCMRAPSLKHGNGRCSRHQDA